MMFTKAILSLAFLSTLTGAIDSGFIMSKSPGNLVPKPVGKDANCTAAYNIMIECSPLVMQKPVLGDPTQMPSTAQLDTICTSGCLKSLETWIRGTKGCSADAFMSYLGLSNTGTSKYCILQAEKALSLDNDSPLAIKSSEPNAFCVDSTCGAQTAWLWSPLKVIKSVKTKKGERVSTQDQDGSMVTLKTACPKLSTSKFPKREESITSKDLASRIVTTENLAKPGVGPGMKPSSSVEKNAKGSGQSMRVEKSVVFSGLVVSVALLLSF
ncbi:hypothetical protein AA313_de0209486 [Arthrobotrys entomopaga]|nr:hypothetical protein AA313_de0209486 [Arthrobotrys entomopaga]